MAHMQELQRLKDFQALYQELDPPKFPQGYGEIQAFADAAAELQKEFEEARRSSKELQRSSKELQRSSKELHWNSKQLERDSKF